MSFLRVFPVIAVIFFVCFSAFADRDGWKSKEADIRAGSGRQIRAIRYPEGKEVLTRTEKRMMEKEPGTLKSSVNNTAAAQLNDRSIPVNAIDSPPIDGFIPWIVVSATDARQEELVFEGIKELSIAGNYLPQNQYTDFVIGLFDTGASAHVVGYQASQILNLGGMETGNYIEISGVTGSVEAWVSLPLGIFIAGFNAVDPSNMTLDTSVLAGESNVSVAVGQSPEPGAPDLPTAIGSPMSVFYTTVFKNDTEITLQYNGKNYTAPDIQIFDGEADDPASGVYDPDIPEYEIKVPLELRPLGGAAVNYIPSFNIYDISGSLDPASPSVIVGNSSQSLFFVHAVDIEDNGRSAYDKDRFMIDTGAQVSVIGTRIAARLGINPADPEFVVDIEGVNGQVEEIGGFYIDSLFIPALGESLTFTNVPVILLDIASPEGGTLDGIIGMNLFNEYNMILRGGGMFLQDDPVLELERITDPPVKLAGDVAPAPVDGVVDTLDLAVCAKAWLSKSGDADFNSLCDIAPASLSDGKIDFQDFGIMASNWLNNLTP